MKNLKRAYRRYKKMVNLKRRARNYYDWSSSLSINKDELCWADYWKEVDSGESGIWMRHTGTPCSCWMCAYDKYDRPLKQNIQKDIWNRIQEHED
jgi:hypothetical protein